MKKVNIKHSFEIRARTVFDVSETINEIEGNDGAENMRHIQKSGRSASFRSKEEAEEYVRMILKDGGCQ